jgi:hypothetical protein
MAPETFLGSETVKFRPFFIRRLAVGFATAVAVLSVALDAAAQATRIGDTFAVAGATSVNHRFPSVSFDAANDAYLVVWGVFPVHARFVSPNGVPLGSAVKVSMATASSAVRVACGKEVNACLVAWLEEAGTTVKVVGRLIRYSGGSVTFITDPFVIATTPANLQFAPAVAFSSASHQFLVAWSASGGIFGQLVSGSGSPVGSIITVDSALVEFAPTATYNSAQNEFMLAYEFESGATSGVRGQRLDGTTGAFLNTPNTLIASTYERYPEITYNSTDNQYLTITYGWSSGKWMLHGAIVNAAGDPITAALPLALNCAGDGLGVTYNPVSKTYFAVSQYAFNNQICGVEVSTSGVPGSPFLVTAVSGGVNETAVQPRVAADQGRTRFLAVAGKNFEYIMGQLLGSGGVSGGGGAPATPSLISPNGTIDTTPNFFWYASSGATHYQLWIEDASGVRTQAWHNAGAVGCSSGTGWCGLAPVTLVKGNGTWWVKAWNPSGESAWSAPMHFTVAGQLGTATQLSPGGLFATNTPVFKWTPATNSSMYYLWVQDGLGVRVQTWYNASAIGCGSGTCSVNPGVALAGTGAWWVQAWSAEQGYGPWSVGMHFTITTPVLLSPSGNHGTTTPNYYWTAVPGATHYQIFVRDSSGVRVQTWYTANDVGCASTSTCAVSAGITLVAGDAVWWVQTWGPEGYGNWSTGTWFRTAVLGQATPIAPSGQLGSSPHVTFTWYAAGGASYYYLWVTDSVGVRVQQWFTATEAGCVAGGTCSVTITPPLYSGPVWWWVMPWAEAIGNGPWSSGLQFIR